MIRQLSFLDVAEPKDHRLIDESAVVRHHNLRVSAEMEIGRAGEYLVMADLLLNGWVAYPSQSLPHHWSHSIGRANPEEAKIVREMFTRFAAMPSMASLVRDTGELLSNQQDFTFDLSSDNSRDRELTAQLVLSRKADDYNNQEVELRLEEPVDATTHFTKYKSARFTVRRSFTSEFDF